MSMCHFPTNCGKPGKLWLRVVLFATTNCTDCRGIGWRIWIAVSIGRLSRQSLVPVVIGAAIVQGCHTTWGKKGCWTSSLFRSRLPFETMLQYSVHYLTRFTFGSCWTCLYTIILCTYMILNMYTYIYIYIYLYTHLYVHILLSYSTSCSLSSSLLWYDQCFSSCSFHHQHHHDHRLGVPHLVFLQVVVSSTSISIVDHT